MNRIDRTIVFRPLQREQLERILDLELARVQERILASEQARIVLRCTPAARTFLLREGTDPKYGARPLKRAIERRLVFPVANLIATRQVHSGDLLAVDHAPSASRLAFARENKGAIVTIAARCA